VEFHIVIPTHIAPFRARSQECGYVREFRIAATATAGGIGTPDR